MNTKIPTVLLSITFLALNLAAAEDSAYEGYLNSQPQEEVQNPARTEEDENNLATLYARKQLMDDDFNTILLELSLRFPDLPEKMQKLDSMTDPENKQRKKLEKEIQDILARHANTAKVSTAIEQTQKLISESADSNADLSELAEQADIIWQTYEDDPETAKIAEQQAKTAEIMKQLSLVLSGEKLQSLLKVSTLTTKIAAYNTNVKRTLNELTLSEIHQLVHKSNDVSDELKTTIKKLQPTGNQKALESALRESLAQQQATLQAEIAQNIKIESETNPAVQEILAEMMELMGQETSDKQKKKVAELEASIVDAMTDPDYQKIIMQHIEYLTTTLADTTKGKLINKL